MSKSVVFMFSGQGSHHYNMGEKLFEGNSIFRQWMYELDEIARKITGDSVISKIYSKNSTGAFDQLLYTHPAIFMVEYSLSQVLIEAGVKPSCVLGASLGEVVAATVAGTLGYENALANIINQSKIFEENCRVSGMLAIFAPLELQNDPVIRRNSQIVGVNFESHFVISATVQKLNKIEDFLNAKQVLFQRLPVSYGFHSSLIDPAEPAIRKCLQSLILKTNTIPIVSCVNGSFLEDISHDHFWDVPRQPIQFQSAIRTLETKKAWVYLDLGPGGTFANFTKRNISASTNSITQPLMTPFNKDLEYLSNTLDFLIDDC